MLLIVWCGLLVLNVFFHENGLPAREPALFRVFETYEEKEKFQQSVVRQLKKIKDLNIRIYMIRQGENYWSIAKDNDIDIDTIIGLNPYLKNIFAGLNEHLLVGGLKGCLHVLQPHEGLRSVAMLYGIKSSRIRKVNRISFLTKLFSPLRPGDVIFVPDAKPRLLTEDMKELFEMRRVLQSPLGGRYTSGYGVREDPITRQKRYHNGLDIKVNIGDWVGSAADGRVIYAGWAGGYGKMVKVEHDNGYTTLYGHLSRILVRVGQRVKRGQIIARAGNTGRTTGAHLHFTVWNRGKPVNPSLFLW